jgi:dipeptidyl aminopeptidase/acylaminoacyl peptidase
LLELSEEGIHAVYRVLNVFTPNATVVRENDGSKRVVNVHPTDDHILVANGESMIEPPFISLCRGNVWMLITTHNDLLMSKTHWSRTYEQFSFKGARNDTVWGRHMPPVNGKLQKAPLAFLIHGGPQNSWYDSWGRGWSFQTYASQGYAVIAINFHGSDSYGQNFTDSITGEYGTLPCEDLQLGLTHVLKIPWYIYGTRALGASFGGYLINWIAGHPEMSQRFRALVSHDGLFNMRKMAYATEELCFTPYDMPEAFEKFNPVNHVANWSQPMLIIQGGRDYRVPDTQSIGAFTALQRRGIPSRLLYFLIESVIKID